MSKERELLKKVTQYAHRGSVSSVEVTMTFDLYKEIMDFLAQPEEGVYQKLLRIEDGIEVEILPSELWMDGYETGRKDPQKREPLSEDAVDSSLANAIKAGWYPVNEDSYRQGFWDGIKFLEVRNER